MLVVHISILGIIVNLKRRTVIWTRCNLEVGDADARGACKLCQDHENTAPSSVGDSRAAANFK